MTNSINKPIVSVFIHCYPPARGGAEYLAEKFVEVLKYKYDVHVFTGKGETLDSYKTFDHYLPNDTGKNIHRLELNQPLQRLFNKIFNKIIFIFGYFSPFYFGPILKYTDKEINIIRQSKIIFGVAMPTKSFYDSYYYAHKYNKKLILVPTYHDVSYYNHCLLFQKAFNYSSKICYLTSFEKDALIKNYTIPNSKLIQTTFCPFTLEQINSQQKKLPAIIKKHQENFNKKLITLGFVGQITLRKNLEIVKEYLDKYMSDWLSKGYTLRVYMAGARTNSSNQVEEMFKDYLDKKIVTIKYDFKNKKNEFSKIDIFINPSKEESLGIVNFEAIYYAVPVIVNNYSAFAELLRSNINLFTGTNIINNNIKKLIGNPINTKQYINNQYNMLKTYNYNNFQTEIIKLI